ncbi:MAG: thiamine pyrophosphate-dependent enzyme [Actinomycetota bacterium]|nr:thiamine pyrophosphate-dependent enzyme [Actinomycetota bacterium]MDH5223801.1 thiamine pyrophosphate-dependent enzyme [Actinomycetota bacterium]MDH5313098.1 thiamine pyrophosphate-dependent enzyme [Actinomycetota bacterium]
MHATAGGLEHVRALMSHATGDEKHEESSTSTVDALWVLYDRVLHIDPARPDAEDRDRFILSKGHGPVAHYAILAAKGFFPTEWLDGFMEHGSRLGSHPDRTLVPGVEASTGSLGHGLSMAVGVAQALRAKGLRDQRVVVLCGDGELNEGSNWEAIALAPHLSLANLTLLLIDNHSSSIVTDSWTDKLDSFGWSVREVDGHDLDGLERALAPVQDVPLAVVADVPEGEW